MAGEEGSADWFEQYKKDATRLADHLRAKGVSPFTCPVCRHNTWQPATRLEFAIPDRPEHVFPAMPLICATCGLVLIFGAVHAGVLGPGGESLDEESAPQTEAD